MNKEWSELNKTIQQQLKANTFTEGIDTLLSLRNKLMTQVLSWKEELSTELRN